ncbi:MAG TPA: FkbM family methyltransferase [Candidatus Sulfotelmatobacter sp.]|nr:FkbM family methyltransferase [Candidatus Sulfotelmatobacter sp.]
MLWHRNDYEDRFAEIMLASVRPEDCVWDIGANVGYYTERFSRLAQHTVAFEPVPENCRQIESKKLTNVECHQIALGDSMGDIPMFVNGPLSSVARASSSGMRAQSVKMMRGDDLVSVRPPAVVKIDVEGYEQEVIRGMYRILGGVRSLFVEIHFQILEDRGMRQAPAAMVKDLNRIGFSKIDWPDASHLAAFRI